MRVSLLIGALASARALEECALSAANECFACPEGARCSTYDPESPETLEVRTGFWRVSVFSKEATISQVDDRRRLTPVFCSPPPVLRVVARCSSWAPY